MDQSDLEAENIAKNNESDQTNDGLTKTTIESDQTNDGFTKNTIKSTHEINEAGQTNDEVTPQRIGPNQTIVGSAGDGDQANKPSNESVKTDDTTNYQTPGCIVDFFSGPPIPESYQEKYAEKCSENIPKPDKPYNLILKNTAIIVIFAAACWGGYRMKKKFFG